MPKIHITPRIAIDESEIEERFVHASGPGGQNVNKVRDGGELRASTSRIRRQCLMTCAKD